MKRPYAYGRELRAVYTTCMFCNKPLGSNQVVETFPVGRRLAFDAQRGRLWVVCRKCERWNLSPLEERWEAVEDCERLFRGTRVRTSTENVGLAKLPEGLELVRIGEPLRPEFAAWRYGDQFGRRRKKAYIYGAAGVAVLGTVLIAGAATGVISGAVLGQSGNFVNLFVNGRTLAKIKAPDGTVVKLKKPHLQDTRILHEGNEWVLLVKKGRSNEYRFEGDDAHRVAGILSSRINRSGAKQVDVQRAVSMLDRYGSPGAIMKAASEEVPRNTFKEYPGHLARLRAPMRLAVEMALHEEQERRALEGELWRLERAWEEAEEIAEIADGLLLPEGAEDFVERHKNPGARADGA